MIGFHRNDVQALSFIERIAGGERNIQYRKRGHVSNQSSSSVVRCLTTRGSRAERCQSIVLTVPSDRITEPMAIVRRRKHVNKPVFPWLLSLTHEESKRRSRTNHVLT